MTAEFKRLHSTPDGGGASALPTRVLVADDSRMQRRILSASLERWGYAVTEAATGAEALALSIAQPFDLVISDWMMPGMTGPELCRAIRALPHSGYAYFILLTSKSDKHDVAAGLDGGADDFLTKPVSTGELRARLAAGERILRMERELQEKNRLVGRTLTEIRGMYESLNRDLKEARKLQQALVPERERDFGAAYVAMAMEACGHVGGDLVGCFPIGRAQVGLFCIDVSGHGVASALLTARLAAFFAGDQPDRNIALAAGAGGIVARDPADVARQLNAILCSELEDDRYLTMFYAVLDLQSGVLRFVQAGHPHPAVLRADGRMLRLGQGGMPVGLMDNATYATSSFALSPGDRLLIVSDGVTECIDAQGNQFEDAGLERVMMNGQSLPAARFLGQLLQTLAFFTLGQDQNDDVSAVLVDYRGSSQRANQRSPSLAR